MNGPGIVVAAPPLRPPVVGLLQAARVVDHPAGDTHWFAGLRWKPADNAALDKIKACAASYALTDTNTGLTTDVDNAEPFELVAHDTCSAFGWLAQDYVARARETLLAKEWGDLEREFEQGALITGNARLAQSVASLTTTPAGSTGIPARNALAALDEAIANARIGLGMIHAPWYVVDLWKEAQAVRVEDLMVSDPETQMPTVQQAIFSPAGNIIVAGSGYQGTDTAGAVDGTHATLWCYATDLIVVHREADVTITPDTLAQAMDRTLNNVTYRASRTYAVEWSRLLHAAVPVATSYTVDAATSQVVTGPAGGAVQVATLSGPLADRSAPIATGGTPQSLVAANAARKYLFIRNPVDATESIWVSIFGRLVADGATTNASATLTSATIAFTAADVGKRVFGPGIPFGTKILSVTNATTATMTANATATATGIALMVGGTELVPGDPFVWEASFIPTNAMAVAAATTGHPYTVAEG